MNEPNIIPITSTPPVMPAEPAADGAALRARLAELLACDILRRFTSAGPRERVLIELVAEVAAGLAHLTKMWRPGCDERIAPLLLAGIDRVARGLHMLGTDRIADTFAERILVDAIAMRVAVLATMPAQGSA